jgi:hypothetical protein
MMTAHLAGKESPGEWINNQYVIVLFVKVKIIFRNYKGYIYFCKCENVTPSYNI